ncbi:hypothetical protein LH20_10870 [Sphingopyxis sp. 113P3]|nr:hypothetical protein LH20_10870 [Sphingopyxis sp. 113P3]
MQRSQIGASQVPDFLVFTFQSHRSPAGRPQLTHLRVRWRGPQTIADPPPGRSTHWQTISADAPVLLR